MNIMEYLILEMTSILLAKKRFNVARNMVEVDKINANIATREEEVLKLFSLENLYEARRFYEWRISDQSKNDLFGVATKDLLDYADKLISLKKEREK